MARKIADNVLFGMSQIDLFKALATGKADMEDATAFAARQNNDVVSHNTETGVIRLRGIRQSFGGLSLHLNEWKYVIDHAPAIQAYIQANVDELVRLGTANRAAQQAAKVASKLAAKAPATV